MKRQVINSYSDTEFFFSDLIEPAVLQPNIFELLSRSQVRPTAGSDNNTDQEDKEDDCKTEKMGNTNLFIVFMFDSLFENLGQRVAQNLIKNFCFENNPEMMALNIHFQGQ